MKANSTNKDDDLRRRNPYRVPDGYFSDLRNNLMARAAEQEAVQNTPKGWWRKLKGAAGFAAAFSFMVLFALVGFYFTGYQAQQRENELASVDMLGGYTLYSHDIETLIYELDLLSDDQAIAEAQQGFEDAVSEYLQTFGYGEVYQELLSDAGYN